MGSLHIWKGTINAERYIQVLEQHMLPSRRRLFQGRPCIFQHDNARPHTASITTSDAPIMIFRGRFRYRFFSSKLADSDSDTDFFSFKQPTRNNERF